MMSPTAIADLAVLLDRARRSGDAITQLTIDNELTVNAAYAVQQAGIALRLAAGERIVGAKLGLTSKAKALQMGVSDVIIGVLTDAMQVPGGGIVDIAVGVHPRVEPEVAFRLGRDIDPTQPGANLRAAVDAVAPALEIIDSRYRDFKFSLADVVADNTSGFAFVVGQWVSLVDSPDLVLTGRNVEMSIDGRVAASGFTTDILGDPWEALSAAVRMAAQYGQRLSAGDILLAGAATAAMPLSAGATVTSIVEGLGQVSVTASGESDTATNGGGHV